MKSTRRYTLIAAVVLLVTVVLWLSTALGQTRKRYEIEAQVYATPEYRTDASRAIDAYERVMERYMDSTERNFVGLASDLRVIAIQLNAIDAKLTKLDTRMDRIERHLGIVPQPAVATPDPNAPSLSQPAPASPYRPR